jgi:uncharacterized protein (DUF924 family)
MLARGGQAAKFSAAMVALRRGPMDQRAAIVSFWFGPLDGDGRSDPAHSGRWFRRDPGFDGEIRQRFLAEVEAALAGQRADWPDRADGALAYVLLLDQFTRNLFRDTPRMFAGDALAIEAAERAVASGIDQELAHDPRGFLYMPFMHSEDQSRQRRSVELFTAMAAATPPSGRERAAAAVDYAVRHRDIVERFGRFPHRNAVLGRTSTPAEQSFLSEPGSSF